MRRFCQDSVTKRRAGNLLDQGASTATRTFVWTPEFGLAIVETAPAGDLRRIVKGISAP
ncbi:hypothetical protein [Nonomuraea sp. NPDC049750]|uniref:hypothetical protein n=1 Tax=Nonomuraea sp. NPDC049750 TaxID=3154738 RepID=UPI003404508B